ncbi:MAG: hypothetical protein K1X67_01285 [Fimbriimonadaceae bacterium]|nr:hypothetical protein [Fimbriimonadaceae bacterium]
MRRFLVFALALTTVWGISALVAVPGETQVQPKALVYLQPTTPGVTQTGHASVSGTIRAGQFEGGGSGLTGINASTLNGLTLTAFGIKAGTNVWAGTNTFSNAANSFTGNGAGLVSVDADRLGGILPTSFALKSGTNAMTGVNTFSNAGNSFSGSGAGLVGLNATRLDSGTVPDPRLAVGGDLLGPLSNATVTGLRGLDVSATVPSTDQILGFDGTQWLPRTDSLTLPYFKSVVASVSFVPAFKIVGLAGSTQNVLQVEGNTTNIPNVGYFLNAGNTKYVGLAGQSRSIETNGFLWKDYAVGAPVEFAAAIPVAYGSVDSLGSILGGTGNFSVVRVASGTYDITVDQEVYSNESFTVNITPVTGSPRFATVEDPGDAFRVSVFNLGGTKSDCGFQFTVWTNLPDSIR